MFRRRGPVKQLGHISLNIYQLSAHSGALFKSLVIFAENKDCAISTSMTFEDWLQFSPIHFSYSKLCMWRQMWITSPPTCTNLYCNTLSDNLLVIKLKYLMLQFQVGETKVCLNLSMQDMWYKIRTNALPLKSWGCNKNFLRDWNEYMGWKQQLDDVVVTSSIFAQSA